MIDQGFVIADSPEKISEQPPSRLLWIRLDSHGCFIDSFSIDGQMGIPEKGHHDQKAEKAAFGSTRVCQISGQS